MQERSFFLVIVVLLAGVASMSADPGTGSVEPSKPWKALWRFDTHG